MANNTIHPNTIEMVKCAAHGVPFAAINYHNFVDKFKLESKWNSRNKVGDKTKYWERRGKKMEPRYWHFHCFIRPFYTFFISKRIFFPGNNCCQRANINAYCCTLYFHTKSKYIYQWKFSYENAASTVLCIHLRTNNSSSSMWIDFHNSKAFGNENVRFFFFELNISQTI